MGALVEMEKSVKKNVGDKLEKEGGQIVEIKFDLD